MPTKLVKFSGQMNRDLKNDLEAYVRSTGQRLSAVYNEMVKTYLRSRLVRPEVLSAADEFIRENKELLNRLSK